MTKFLDYSYMEIDYEPLYWKAELPREGNDEQHVTKV